MITTGDSFFLQWLEITGDTFRLLSLAKGVTCNHYTSNLSGVTGSSLILIPVAL